MPLPLTIQVYVDPLWFDLLELNSRAHFRNRSKQTSVSRTTDLAGCSCTHSAGGELFESESYECSPRVIYFITRPAYELFRINRQCFCVGLTLPQAKAMVSNTRSKRNPGLQYGFRGDAESRFGRGSSALPASSRMHTHAPLSNILGRNAANPVHVLRIQVTLKVFPRRAAAATTAKTTVNYLGSFVFHQRERSPILSHL
jgi:hypothetical protein